MSGERKDHLLRKGRINKRIKDRTASGAASWRRVNNILDRIRDESLPAGQGCRKKNWLQASYVRRAYVQPERQLGFLGHVLVLLGKAKTMGASRFPARSSAPTRARSQGRGPLRASICRRRRWNANALYHPVASGAQYTENGDLETWRTIRKQTFATDQHSIPNSHPVRPRPFFPTAGLESFARDLSVQSRPRRI